MAGRHRHPIRIGRTGDSWERNRGVGHQGLDLTLYTTRIARSRVYYRVTTEMGNSLEHCICLPDRDTELDDPEHQKEQYRQRYCRFDQDGSVLAPAQR